MADKKISALPAATTPLAGTEVLPIVQGGTTDKVSVADLTAGRAVTALSQSVASFTPDGGGFIHQASASNAASRYWRSVNDLSAWADWALQQSTDNTGAAYTTRFYFDGNGNATVSTGNLVIGTAGKGIDFSANTGLPGATSELLDWYEEGTWAIADTSGAGLTLTVDHAKYTRVGNLVTGNAYVTYPVTADASANQLSLPYTAAKYDIGTAGASTGNVYSAITIGGGAQMSVRNLSLQPLLNSNLSGADILINFTYMV